MKINEGEKGIGMTEAEARRFLKESKSTLILGTTNSDGSPMIHPVWFHFDSAKTKLYFYTEPALRKATNIMERNRVYFDVDNDRWPYKGVKGGGRARMVGEKKKALLLAAKVLSKYVRKGQPLTEAVMRKVETGGYVIFEITPSYFTTWDYGKLVSQSKSLEDAVVS
jgi:nitroimidazol reductase NimA-like FMN-containing flavoprotein (pyridoxamine 5'-phosphate oxidase superfamily)